MTQEFSKNLGEAGHEQTIHDVSVVSSENVTFNQTQIIQISVEEVKTRKFIITSPYKGLKKFESEDKDRFFGRDQFLTGLVNELDQTNFVLLLGASGSGKSSVIRAGLIPWLAERQGSHFMNLVFTPDQDPFESLYASLLGKYKQSEAQIARIAKEDTLTQLVRSLKQADAYWFILIDQFEELFTTTEFSKRDVFIKSLVQLVKTLDKASDRSVKLVATMRADFLDRLSPYPDLIKVTDRHRPMIAEMQLDELRLAIEQPAAHHGVVFETGLVEQIIDDVQGQAGYLPLLQYTLNLLWETEVQSQSIQDRTLNISNYRKLGGVRGALQQHVDQIYKSLSESEKLAAQRIFLKLVGIGEDEESGTEWKPVRRRATRSEFSDPLEQKVLTQLVNQNLLVSNCLTDSQESTIEIAHEALLTSWVTLNSWIKENRQAIALRNRLNDDVEQWKKTKSHEDLWSGSRLEQALELRKDETFNQVLGGLSQEANQFLDASQGERDRIQKEKVRLQRRAIRWLSGGLAVAVLFALAAGWQWKRADRQTQLADVRTQAAESINQLSISPSQGLVQGIQALGVGKQLQNDDVFTITQSSLLEAVERSRERSVFRGDEKQPKFIKLSADDRFIVIMNERGDQVLKIWDWQGQPITPSPIIEKFKESPNFESVGNLEISSPNGQIIARGSDWGDISLFDRNGQLLTTLKGHTNRITYLAFSPDSKHLVSVGGWLGVNESAQITSDNTVRLWDIESGLLSKAIPEGGNRVAISSDGKTIASATDSTIQLWNQEGALILSSPFTHHKSLITSVAFSPKDRTILSTDAEGTLLLWDFQGNLVAPPMKQGNFVFSAVFSPDGQIIASGDIKGQIQLWNLQGKQLKPPFQAHQDEVNKVAFSPDGTMIVSASGSADAKDNSIRLWDLQGNPIGKTFREHTNIITSVVFSPNGKMIASGSNDNTVRLWNLKGEQLLKIDLPAPARSLAFSPDGKMIAVGVSGVLVDSGAIYLWDLKGKLIGSPFKHNGSVESVVFSPDGKQIISGSKDKTVRFWVGNWQGWLDIACNRIRYHSALNDPETLAQDEIARGARETCQKYSLD